MAQPLQIFVGQAATYLQQFRQGANAADLLRQAGSVLSSLRDLASNVPSLKIPEATIARLEAVIRGEKEPEVTQAVHEAELTVRRSGAERLLALKKPGVVRKLEQAIYAAPVPLPDGFHLDVGSLEEPTAARFISGARSFEDLQRYLNLYGRADFVLLDQVLSEGPDWLRHVPKAVADRFRILAQRQLWLVEFQRFGSIASSSIETRPLLGEPDVNAIKVFDAEWMPLTVPGLDLVGALCVFEDLAATLQTVTGDDHEGLANALEDEDRLRYVRIDRGLPIPKERLITALRQGEPLPQNILAALDERFRAAPVAQPSEPAEGELAQLREANAETVARGERLWTELASAHERLRITTQDLDRARAQVNGAEDARDTVKVELEAALGVQREALRDVERLREWLGRLPYWLSLSEATWVPIQDAARVAVECAQVARDAIDANDPDKAGEWADLAAEVKDAETYRDFLYKVGGLRSGLVRPTDKLRYLEEMDELALLDHEKTLSKELSGLTKPFADQPLDTTAQQTRVAEIGELLQGIHTLQERRRQQDPIGLLGLLPQDFVAELARRTEVVDRAAQSVDDLLIFRVEDDEVHEVTHQTPLERAKEVLQIAQASLARAEQVARYREMISGQVPQPQDQKQLAELRGQVEALNGQLDLYRALLAQARSALEQTQREAAWGQVDATRSQDLAADNAQLLARLAETDAAVQARLAEVSLEGDAAQQVAVGLREELAGVNESLTVLLDDMAEALVDRPTPESVVQLARLAQVRIRAALREAAARPAEPAVEVSEELVGLRRQVEDLQRGIASRDERLRVSAKDRALLDQLRRLGDALRPHELEGQLKFWEDHVVEREATPEERVDIDRLKRGIAAIRRLGEEVEHAVKAIYAAGIKVTDAMGILGDGKFKSESSPMNVSLEDASLLLLRSNDHIMLNDHVVLMLEVSEQYELQQVRAGEASGIIRSPYYVRVKEGDTLLIWDKGAERETEEPVHRLVVRINKDTKMLRILPEAQDRAEKAVAEQRAEVERLAHETAEREAKAARARAEADRLAAEQQAAEAQAARERAEADQRAAEAAAAVPDYGDFGKPRLDGKGVRMRLVGADRMVQEERYYPPDQVRRLAGGLLETNISRLGVDEAKARQLRDVVRAAQQLLEGRAT